MIADWIVYGVIIWGLATALNATAYKATPASRGGNVGTNNPGVFH